MPKSNEDPICDSTGSCSADPSDRGISNCIHCGKELIEKDGKWFTWDADLYKNPRPQGYIY